MGKFLPVFVANLQFACGVHIFKKRAFTGSVPLFSCLIVVSALFLLLLEAPLYPRSLQKLRPCADDFVQYLVASFIVERVMADFWFPLEVAVSGLLPWLAEMIDLWCDSVALEDSEICDGICVVLESVSMGLFCNYLISLFVLFNVLHATKYIDLGILKYGVSCFLASIIASLVTKCEALKQALCRCDVDQNQRDRLNSGRKPCSNPVEDTSDDFDENWYSRQYIE